MTAKIGIILVAAVAATCTTMAAGNGRPEESVECPVSANMRGHENTEWSIYYGYHLTDQNRHLPRVLLGATRSATVTSAASRRSSRAR